MNKPQIADYVEMPRSTTTGVNINYRAYSCALEQYINYLESEVKNLNIQNVSQQSELLNSFLDYLQESEKDGEKIVDRQAFINGFLKLFNCG